MKYLTFSFTNNAMKLALNIHTQLINRGDSCISYTTCKKNDNTTLFPLTVPLQKQLEQHFNSVDCIIFISACGIAVRSIAPLIKSKTTDPSVVVIDELGRYAISLLSGHIGGGNEQTITLANLIHAVPVISTATDLNRLFSVDTFAKKNNLYIDNMTVAKEISSTILSEEPVGIYSDYPIKGVLPDYLINYAKDVLPQPAIGFIISLNLQKTLYKKNLHLIPRAVILGVGCRKGISFTQLESSIQSILIDYNISIHSVNTVVSIDLKAEEKGLLQFCNTYHLPFHTYSCLQLNSLSECFTPSEFVQSITGVDNVCERAAKFYCPDGTFLFRKTSKNGVTVAAILEPFTISLQS